MNFTTKKFGRKRFVNANNLGLSSVGLNQCPPAVLTTEGARPARFFMFAAVVNCATRNFYEGKKYHQYLSPNLHYFHRFTIEKTTKRFRNRLVRYIINIFLSIEGILDKLMNVVCRQQQLVHAVGLLMLVDENHCVQARS